MATVKTLGVHHASIYTCTDSCITLKHGALLKYTVYLVKHLHCVLNNSKSVFDTYLTLHFGKTVFMSQID